MHEIGGLPGGAAKVGNTDVPVPYGMAVTHRVVDMARFIRAFVNRRVGSDRNMASLISK